MDPKPRPRGGKNKPGEISCPKNGNCTSLQWHALDLWMLVRGGRADLGIVRGLWSPYLVHLRIPANLSQCSGICRKEIYAYAIENQQPSGLDTVSGRQDRDGCIVWKAEIYSVGSLPPLEDRTELDGHSSFKNKHIFQVLAQRREINEIEFWTKFL